MNDTRVHAPNAPTHGHGLYKRGLGRTLLLSFLAISLIPATAISVASYLNARSILRHGAHASLMSVAQSKTQQVRAQFDGMIEDLTDLSQMGVTIHLLERLEEESTHSPSHIDFVRSPRWAEIVKEPGADLARHRQTHGYHDIFLIDHRGTILFTVAQETDLGMNLFTGRLAHTPLAEACRRVMETGEPTFSDFERYAPSNNAVAGFLVIEVVDRDAKRLGFLAFQVRTEQIHAVMLDRTGMSKTLETYLVGEDRKLRSRLYRPSDLAILGEPVITHQTAIHHQGIHGHAALTTARIYAGPRGVPVLGIHADIRVAGVPLTVIAEIDEAEAFGPADQMMLLVMLMLLVTVVAVVIVAFMITRRVVTPVERLTWAVDRIATGDLTFELGARPSNEIGRAFFSLEEMQRSLQHVAEHANRVARGDFEVEVQPRSTRDKLGCALHNMLISLKTVVGQANTIASGDYSAEIEPQSPNDKLGTALQKMTRHLRRSGREIANEDWVKTGQTQLNLQIRGEQDVVSVGHEVLTFLARFLDAQVGVFYLMDRTQTLTLVASYAYERRKRLSNTFALGQGLPGQAALEKTPILLTDVPTDYLEITSGTGATPPRHIRVTPVLYEGAVKGVLELGTIHPFSELQLRFIDEVTEGIGVAIQVAQAREQMQDLLERSQAQAEQLQSQTEVMETQQEELRQTNESLEHQTLCLRESEMRLQAQQEELRQTNEELATHTEALQGERAAVERKNDELEAAKRDLEAQADALTRASRYKSEFLANMSHELRTPLNSLLILSKILTDNKEGNLTERQVEFASVIHKSGDDLLGLINEILDLAKVESGKLSLDVQEVNLEAFVGDIERGFQPLAAEKGLRFSAHVADALPDSIRTDPQRLLQVINNLLFNALKFTHQGSITLTIDRPTRSLCDDITHGTTNLDLSQAIAMTVADTGIGVPPEKQKLIFEAFHQIDGSTARHYGGTGLGLAICRELMALLGGRIHLQSQSGEGSSFSVVVPEISPVDATGDEPHETAPLVDDPAPAPPQSASPVVAHETLPMPAESSPPSEGQCALESRQDTPVDDRESLQPGDKSILIVEDDQSFTRTLCALATERGFKTLIASDGEAALRLADAYLPSAILLDLNLPGMDGLGVLHRLKDSLRTRHIPVNVISGYERAPEAIDRGAAAFFAKPVSVNQINDALGNLERLMSRRPRNLLIAASSDATLASIVELTGGADVQITPVGKGVDALDRVRTAEFDCMVLDPDLSDMSGLDLLKQMKETPSLCQLPVIVATTRALTHEEVVALDQYADRIVPECGLLPERLLDETALFLHRVEQELPDQQRRMIHSLYDEETIFKERKILLADDDMRNAFALSAVLEDKGLDLVLAKNGREAVDRLAENPDVAAVLMDIMMPEMDGYEAMRQIRAQARFAKLPIIALTAKAMKEDRAKCIEAGANDYMAKPVDDEKLVSMLRVWLYQ